MAQKASDKQWDNAGQNKNLMTKQRDNVTQNKISQNYGTKQDKDYGRAMLFHVIVSVCVFVKVLKY